MSFFLGFSFVSNLMLTCLAEMFFIVYRIKYLLFCLVWVYKLAKRVTDHHQDT